MTRSIPSRRFVSSLRRPSARLVLYQFRDSNQKPTSSQTWHIIGDEAAIRKFITHDEIRFLAPSVSWPSLDGEVKYLGVYKKRMVGRFRRVLRERGAELNVRYERPLLSESRQFHLHWNYPGK